MAARHIDKVGGLDNYILNVPKQKQQSDLAQQLRQRIEAALQKPLRDALKANSEVCLCSAIANHRAPAFPKPFCVRFST